MSDFVKEMKQTGYSNPVREDFEMTIRQEDTRNSAMIGQFIDNAKDLSKTAYDVAKDIETRQAKTAKEQAEARKIADYNEFARRKQQINAQAEQTGNWTAADTATRKLIDDFSRRPGVEAGKLYDLAGKTDFTGAYAREKDTRTFWNNKNNDEAYKAVEALRTANPSVAATLSPEETYAYVSAVNDSWDKATGYISQLNSIDRNQNPSEYARVKNRMQEELGNNVVATSMLEIFDNQGKIKTSADLELFRVKSTEKLVKAGIDRATATIIVDQGYKRSGVADLVEAANSYQTLTTEDIQRTIKYNVEMGKAEMGATKNIFSALMVSSDNWQKGDYYSDILNREVGKTWNTMLEELALTGKVTKGLGTTDADRGQIYGGAVDILKSRLSAPLKGGAVSQVFDDVTKAYNDRSAEERVQGFSEVLNKFDNAYLDVNIQQLLSSSLPEHREAGKALQKKREDLINAKDMAVYETSNTPGADALNYLRQGPGASLLRVTNDGQLVVVDGSKGFLQSTAITLSDATGRYFGYVSDFNKEFADMFEDADTRKNMLEAGNIPALDQMKETVIGRKEWYLGTGKAKTEEDIAKEKAVAELDAQWKGRPKTGAYWKARREIEDSFAGEPYNLADLPGDIVEGVGTGLKKAGKGIIKGAQGIGVGINKMLGNKTVWDKPEQELKGTGSYSTSIEMSNPKMVPADEYEYEAYNEEPQQEVQQPESYTEPDIIYNTEMPMDIVSDIVMYIESSGNPDAVSNKGAVGLMQLMPKTFKDIAKRYDLPSDDIKDPYTNKIAGQIYLAELDQRFNGDIDKVLSSYNAGPTKVNALIKKHGKNWRRYLPEETKNYLRKYYDILSKGAW